MTSKKRPRILSNLGHLNPEGLQLAHLSQELAVCSRLGQSLNQQLHGFDWRQRVQYFAEDPDALQVFFGNQQLFFAGAGALDIDRWESSFVDQLAVEDDF